MIINPIATSTHFSFYIMKEFIEILPGIKIRPEYVVRKEIRYDGDRKIFLIKVLGDREYYVPEEIYIQIQ